MEFAATPALFGLIGHFLDSRLGTSPWLTIALVLFAVTALVVRAYYGYVAAMDEHAANAPWRKRPPLPEGQPSSASPARIGPGAGDLPLAEGR